MRFERTQALERMYRQPPQHLCVVVAYVLQSIMNTATIVEGRACPRTRFGGEYAHPLEGYPEGWKCGKRENVARRNDREMRKRSIYRRPTCKPTYSINSICNTPRTVFVSVFYIRTNTGDVLGGGFKNSFLCKKRVVVPVSWASLTHQEDFGFGMHEWVL